MTSDFFNRISNLFHNPGLKKFFRVIQRKLSLITLWLIFASVANYNVQNKDWLDSLRLIRDDVHNYYIYASAIVVYKDYHFEKVYDQIPAEVKTNFWIVKNQERDRYYSKMSMGMAMLYAPFTAFAHYVLVPLMDYPADGYSPPYKIGLLISALCFFLLGLWQLRKILLKYFNEHITALTLIVIALGTNLTWYASSEASMTHVYSFALVAFFYRMLERWFEKPGIGLAVLNGLVFGLIVLIRPTNIMYVVLFFVGDTFAARLKFLLKNYWKLMLMILAFLIVWTPQLLFWKWVSGDWLLYSYGKEGFFWNNPQIISSLFSYRKGWLVYTPLMVLSFVGLPFLWIKYRGLFWQVFMVLVLAIYINSSWWCWWFGGSFGNRSFIDAYGIYALAIAAVFQAVAGLKKWILSAIGVVLIAAFVRLNLFQTWQYRMGLIHYVSETKTTYWINFLQTKHQPEFFENLVYPDHIAGLVGYYYPKTEITEAERKVLKMKIQYLEPCLLEWFKTKQLEQLSVNPKYNQSDNIDSIAEVESVKDYKAFKIRQMLY